MAKFTLDQITEALEAVVAERGEEYRYDDDFEKHHASYGCRYIIGEKPACIVGALYSRLGVSNSTLKKWNGYGGVRSIAFHSRLIPDEAEEALGRTQASQDTGHTWGQALEMFRSQIAAEREMERV